MPRLLKKNLFTITLLLMVLALPVFVMAAPGDPPADAGAWFRGIIERILNLIVWPIFIAAAIIMFIWAGILFLSSHGDPTKVGDARKALLWAVIGIVVGLLGYVAVGVLRGLLAV